MKFGGSIGGRIPHFGGRTQRYSASSIGGFIVAIPCSAKTPSQVISLDLWVSGLHASGMKILLMMAFVQSPNLVIFAWSNRVAGPADPRAQAATHGVQAQVEETDAEKQGSAVLVVAVKDLEGLDIRADPREARDRDPTEGEEVSGVLA